MNHALYTIMLQEVREQVYDRIEQTIQAHRLQRVTAVRVARLLMDTYPFHERSVQRFMREMAEAGRLQRHGRKGGFSLCRYNQ